MSHVARMIRARCALEGLSLGDAFGEKFFGAPERVVVEIAERVLPPPVWSWTDDTAMALSIVEVLDAHRGVECEPLAARFADRYIKEPARGYGGGAQDILGQIARGTAWHDAAASVFGGGSMGNGAAMRVAPVGAYFADDMDEVIRHAVLSARPTHLHAEGQAGAVSVAVAAAMACRGADAATLLSAVIDATPDGATRDGLRRARDLGLTCEVATAADVLGNGRKVISSDTVPFSIWAAARHLDDYVSAMWTTVSALGDRDTTCAIVGGILGARVRESGLPQDWIARREPLPLAKVMT